MEAGTADGLVIRSDDAERADEDEYRDQERKVRSRRRLGSFLTSFTRLVEAKRLCIAVGAVIVILGLELFNKIDTAVAREAIESLVASKFNATSKGDRR